MEDRKNLSHIRTPDVKLDHLQKDLSQSEQLYSTYCSSCHQQDGKGATGNIPPLAASEWVLGDKVHLSDEELALILTYIRQNFVNNAGLIDEQDVESRR